MGTIPIWLFVALVVSVGFGVFALWLGRRAPLRPMTHFSAIGLDVSTLGDMQRIADLALERGERRPVPGEPGYSYLTHRFGEGSAITLGVDPEAEYCFATPWIEARDRNRVRLESVVADAKVPIEGGFQAWAGVDGEPGPATGEADGGFPFQFDCPELRVHSEQALPRIADVVLAVFAHEFEVFADEAAFDEHQAKEGGPKFAPRSFIPIGLFGPARFGTDDEGSADRVGADAPAPVADAGPAGSASPAGEGVRSADTPPAEAPPKALGLFTGVVLEAGQRKNAWSGGPYWWLRVETLALTVDVVADARQLEHAPSPGNVVRVSGWLVGRVS